MPFFERAHGEGAPGWTSPVEAEPSQSNLSHDEFFDVVEHVARFFSHGLGNMLTGLGLTLDMMSTADPVDPKLVVRAVRMMDRLRDFKDNFGSLGGGGRSELRPQELTPLFKTVLAEARLTDEYSVHVVVAAEAEHLTCHEGLLKRALGYLLRNATDAMPQGGKLGLEARREGEEICITVWDEGPGVPASMRPKLFLQPVTSKPYGGGLGLMLVAMIVQRIHGGQVHYQDHALRGGEFCLRLPVAPRLRSKE